MAFFILFVLVCGAINPVYGYLVFGGYVVFLRQVLFVKRVYLNCLKQQTFVLLGLFGFMYWIFSGLSIQNLLYYFIAPLFAYSAGWVILDNQRDDEEKILEKAIGTIVLSLGVHAILNLIISVGRQRWELTDFFSGTLRSATGLGYINTIILSLLVYLLVIEKRRIIKIIGLIFFCTSLAYQFILGGRMQVAILVIVNILILFLYMKENNQLKEKMKVIFIVIAIGLIALFLYSKNIFGIRDMVEKSNFMIRILTDTTTSDQYRTSSIIDGFVNLIDYPFGIPEGYHYYYHNMWLDIGGEAGVIPFVLMLLYSLCINIHAIRVFRFTMSNIRYVIIAIYLGIQINFASEPVLEGMIDAFLLFCFINGLIENYYRRCLIIDD